MEPLTFERFVEHLQGELATPTTDSDVRAWLPSARLIDDLGLDSIARFEMIVVVEELGSFVDPDRLEDVVTLRDLYRLYVAALAPLTDG